MMLNAFFHMKHVPMKTSMRLQLFSRMTDITREMGKLIVHDVMLKHTHLDVADVHVQLLTTLYQPLVRMCRKSLLSRFIIQRKKNSER